MSTPGRRRSDRAGWPLRDRLRYRRGRILAGVRRSALAVAVVFAIALSAGAVIYAIQTDRDNDRQSAAERFTALQRDEARKYQACLQRRRGLINQNILVTVARGSLLTAHRRQALQARKTNDPQLRARFRLGSAIALDRRRQLAPSALPGCRETYPLGYQNRDRFPDLAKQNPPPTTTTTKAPR